MKVLKLTPRIAGALLLATTWAPLAQAATPAELLSAYTAEAGAPASPERGQKLFTTNFRKQMGWSCSSCHTANPTKDGRDEMSEKKIRPLAPAANPARFTDRTKVENAFRMNCRDVMERECTAAEKADVLAWLISLKP
jgi:mono/diheme cytochrome c family protein